MEIIGVGFDVANNASRGCFGRIPSVLINLQTRLFLRKHAVGPNQFVNCYVNRNKLINTSRYNPRVRLARNVRAYVGRRWGLKPLKLAAEVARCWLTTCGALRKMARLTQHPVTLTCPIIAASKWKGVYPDSWLFIGNRRLICKRPSIFNNCFKSVGADFFSYVHQSTTLCFVVDLVFRIRGLEVIKNKLSWMNSI